MNDPAIVLLDFRALLEAAPDAIAVVDDGGQILLVNDQMSKLTGYDSSELVGTRVEDLIPVGLRKRHVENRSSYNSKPSRRPMGIGLDLLVLRKDGTERPVEISLSPISSSGQTFTIAVARDISERQRSQAEREELRSALDTERERYRIGMDLHDGVMQDVYAVTLGLEVANEDIAADPKLASEGVERAIDQLHRVIRDIRSFIFDLRPREFNGDLRRALTDLGGEFQENSGIPTRVETQDNLPEIDSDVALAFYLVTHEALSNIRKHAHATQVAIILSQTAGTLSLEVRDNGRGFDPAVAASAGHRGLRNISTRAAGANANLNILSAPGEGTTVVVSVSLD